MKEVLPIENVRMYDHEGKRQCRGRPRRSAKYARNISHGDAGEERKDAVNDVKRRKATGDGECEPDNERKTRCPLRKKIKLPFLEPNAPVR